jgi:hypothetical protein
MSSASTQSLDGLSTSSTPLTTTTTILTSILTITKNDTNPFHLRLLNQLFLQSTTCQVITGFFAWAALLITAHHVCFIKFIFLYLSFSFVIILLNLIRYFNIYKIIMSKMNKNGLLDYYS